MRARLVARGMAGRMMAASRPMIASTQTISIRVKPSCRELSSMQRVSLRLAECSQCRQRFQCRPPDRRNRARRSRRAHARPGSDRRTSVPTDRSEPRRRSDMARSSSGTWSLRQRDQAFVGGRIAPEIEVIKVERAGEAFDLDLRGLDLGFAEIVRARAGRRAP